MDSKVMLVDDHPLFLEGLQYLLETNGINILGIAKSGTEALVKARILKPDIILMDIRMPECSGLDALKLINAEMPDIKVIMLTTSEEDEDLFDAIRYGASGYLLKSLDVKSLIGMLSDLDNNETPLSPGLAARLLKEFRHNNTFEHSSTQQTSACEKGSTLTMRQMEVLEMVAKGITYKEAGDALGLSERTVKYHMGRILELLHLENRAQVITFAARMGLVQDTEDPKDPDTNR